MLRLASTHQQLSVVRYLVENRANINAVNERGRTPLDIAVGAKQRANIHFLKFHGAQHSRPTAPQTNQRYQSAHERRRRGL